MVVQDLRRADHRDPLAVHGRPVGLVRLVVVPPRADHGDARAARLRERVAQPDGAIVHPVVVRDVRDVDAARVQRVERARRRPERERLLRGAAAIRDCRLEVDDRHVRTAQNRRDRREHADRRRGETLPDRALEVDVAAERQCHRLPTPQRVPSRGGGGRGRPTLRRYRSRDRRRSPDVVRSRGAAAADEEAQCQREQRARSRRWRRGASCASVADAARGARRSARASAGWRAWSAPGGAQRRCKAGRECRRDPDRTF